LENTPLPPGYYLESFDRKYEKRKRKEKNPIGKKRKTLGSVSFVEKGKSRDKNVFLGVNVGVSRGFSFRE
jgi:hypothetical protein